MSRKSTPQENEELNLFADVSYVITLGGAFLQSFPYKTHSGPKRKEERETLSMFHIRCVSMQSAKTAGSSSLNEQIKSCEMKTLKPFAFQTSIFRHPLLDVETGPNVTLSSMFLISAAYCPSHDPDEAIRRHSEV